MDFNKLTQGERIVLIAGVLLIIDLLVLPWHKISLGGLIDVNRTGVQSPNAFYGVLALLLTLVMVGVIIASKLAGAKLPDLPVTWGQVHLIAGILVFALLLLKLIVETNFLGFGAYLGLLLGAAVAFGGFSINKETATRGSAF
ncbi:MAG: hypothetical protein QOI56_1698 [Actinomycetota bacterium]|jgi:hypothetical protein|nr:hypothetical protein [Actinomycetota bacterium]MEA2932913.1 hypothetical protein [Actinomycetota bacterium]